MFLLCLPKCAKAKKKIANMVRCILNSSCNPKPVIAYWINANSGAAHARAYSFVQASARVPYVWGKTRYSCVFALTPTNTELPDEAACFYFRCIYNVVGERSDWIAKIVLFLLLLEHSKLITTIGMSIFNYACMREVKRNPFF